jgi:5'-3' exonuclease
VEMLLRHSITPVFIYDGKSPPEKHDKIQDRRDKKRAIQTRIALIRRDYNSYTRTGEVSDTLKTFMSKSKLFDGTLINSSMIQSELNLLQEQNTQVSHADFLKSIEFLDVIGVPHHTATGEAEMTCSALCKTQKVSAVLSDDTDVIAHGTPIALSKINVYEELCVEISYDVLLKELDVNSMQFTDFCIMCGTDYNNNIPNIGCERSMRLIKKHRTIEEIGKIEKHDISILNQDRIREIFDISNNIDCSDICTTMVDCDVKKLGEFWSDNNIRLSLKEFNKLL